MRNLFLFSRHLTDDSCVCVITDNGTIIGPLKKYSLTEINQLQKTCAKTIVVMPSERTGLHSIESVWLSDKKARTVLPFMLEEKLAENIDNVHLAFDKSYHQDNHYLVAVCNNSELADILSILTSYDIICYAITSEWCALKDQDIAIFEHTLVSFTQNFKGTLSANLLSLAHFDRESMVYVFKDSNPTIVNSLHDKCNFILEEKKSCEWTAQQLSQKSFINFIQGRFQRPHTANLLKYQLWGISILLGLSLVSFIILNTITLIKLKKNIAPIDNQIAIIYHQFFSATQPVITPKFRLERLLKQRKNQVSSNFWTILSKFIKCFNSKNFYIKQLNFHNQMMIITLELTDFKALEQLQARLQQQRLIVKQTQATTQKNKVLSTLELTNI